MVNKQITAKQDWYKLQAYMPPETKEALDEYIEAKYHKGSRVVSAIAIKALDDFLEKEGFPVKRGGEKDEVTD